MMPQANEPLQADRLRRPLSAGVGPLARTPFKYDLTTFGRTVATTALKLRELVILRAFQKPVLGDPTMTVMPTA